MAAFNCAHDGGDGEKVPSLTAAEENQSLAEWNDTYEDYPRERCAHELIEATVEQTPQATAVVFEGEQLTYEELNRRSNQLAQYLRKVGVGKDVLVGLCVD